MAGNLGLTEYTGNVVSGANGSEMSFVHEHATAGVRTVLEFKQKLDPRQPDSLIARTVYDPIEGYTDQETAAEVVFDSMGNPERIALILKPPLKPGADLVVELDAQTGKMSGLVLNEDNDLDRARRLKTLMGTQDKQFSLRIGKLSIQFNDSQGFNAATSFIEAEFGEDLAKIARNGFEVKTAVAALLENGEMNLRGKYALPASFM